MYLSMKRFFVPLLLVFFLFCSRELNAHPHVFIDTRVTVVFDQKGITGFLIEWKFDEMFSAMIIQDFDEDYDSSFSSAEIENIERNAFSNLKNYHYFTYISWKGGEYDGKRVEDFYAAIRGGTLVYRFFVPCRISVVDKEKLVKVWVYDDSYYCDVVYAEDVPVNIEGMEGYSIRYEIVQDVENPYYYGQVFPLQLRLSFWKNDG
jgi:ABC-type uncharacterized transport system substrate-binding protein